MIYFSDEFFTVVVVLVVDVVVFGSTDVVGVSVIGAIVVVFLSSEIKSNTN